MRYFENVTTFFLFLIQVNSRITELVGDLAERDRNRENNQREQVEKTLEILINMLLRRPKLGNKQQWEVLRNRR